MLIGIQQGSGVWQGRNIQRMRRIFAGNPGGDIVRIKGRIWTRLE
jgi:hypothetical protein